MTTDKAFKRIVRARMAKTGERYAAARRSLIDTDTTGRPIASTVETAAGRTPSRSHCLPTGSTGSSAVSAAGRSRPFAAGLSPGGCAAAPRAAGCRAR